MIAFTVVRRSSVYRLTSGYERPRTSTDELERRQLQPELPPRRPALSLRRRRWLWPQPAAAGFTRAAVLRSWRRRWTRYGRLLAQAVNENPDFAGSSIAVDLTGVGSGHYLLGDDDLRTQFFTDLGFTVPDASTDLSQERLDLLNADVLAVNGYNQEDADADTLFSSLDVVTQGRTVLLGSYSGDVSAALGFGSPLSLPYLLDEAVPALAAAADGDPSTVVPALG
ncbi:MAG TPA: hypothetical protein VLJ85_01890 [Geodermatophilus sp.]|jgi:hypothetical protein|nr:hypothetical protein [Geodermatophilus sp.]